MTNFFTQKAKLAATLPLAQKNSRHSMSRVLTILAAIFFIAWNNGAQAQTTWNGNQNFTSNTTINGAVVVNGDRDVTVASGVTVTITGGLTIKDQMNKKGAGTLIVRGRIDGWDATGQEKGKLDIQAGILQEGENSSDPQIRRFHEVKTSGTGALVISGSGTVNFWQSENDDNSAFFFDIDYSTTGSIGNYQYVPNLSFNTGGVKWNGSGTMVYRPSNGAFPVSNPNYRFNYSPDCGYIHAEQGTVKITPATVISAFPYGMTVGMTVLAGATVEFNVQASSGIGTWTFPSTIDGAGTIKKTGTSTLVISGICDNFTGTLDVNAATLKINPGGYMSYANLVLSSNTAKVDLTGEWKRFRTLNSTFANAEITSGSGIEIGNDNNLYNSGGGTYAGKFTGSGHLYKRGYQTLKLTGVNSLTGGTEIKEGNIEFSAANNFGGIIRFGSSSGDATSPGLIWATGTTADISSLITSVENVYGIEFNTSGNNVTLASVLPNMGDKGIIKEGAGILTFTADMNVEDIMIYGGTLQMGNGGVGGFLNVQHAGVNENALLKFNLSSDKTFAGDISPYADGANTTGAVEKAGNGKLTITKNWSHEGGVTISGGILQLGSGSSAEGKIVRSDINISNANAKLIINFTEDYDLYYPGWTNQAPTWVFPPKQCKITGIGSVEKLGSGKLTALGGNTCTGQFTHSGGKLSIYGWSGKYVQNTGATLTAHEDDPIELGSMQLNGGGYLEFPHAQNYNCMINVYGAFSASGNTTIIPSILSGTNPASSFVLIDAESGLSNTAYFTLNLPAYPQANLTIQDNKKLMLNLTASTAIENEDISAAGINMWVDNNYELKITNYENLGVDNVSIYNALGQIMCNSRLSTSINVSNWTSGMYIVKIGNYTKKFIKK